LEKSIRAVWSDISSYPLEERDIKVDPAEKGIWIHMTVVEAVDPGAVGQTESLLLSMDEALDLAEVILKAVRESLESRRV